VVKTPLEPAFPPLAALGAASAPTLARLELALAELLLEHGPPGARAHLELAARFLDGRATAEELADARQECWAHAGALACGCSAADSATAAAFLAVLDASPRTLQSLAEQIQRALRGGVSEAQVLELLGTSAAPLLKRGELE
jgi:hypothetical protein